MIQMKRNTLNTKQQIESAAHPYWVGKDFIEEVKNLLPEVINTLVMESRKVAERNKAKVLKAAHLVEVCKDKTLGNFLAVPETNTSKQESEPEPQPTESSSDMLNE